MQQGTSTGWHMHPGIVLVTIEDGSVEWYDAKCLKHIHKAGDFFTEDDQPHFVRNVVFIQLIRLFQCAAAQRTRNRSVKRASRSTLAGRRYLDLQQEAKRTGRPTDELIQLYALECFLDRLVHSDFATLGGTLSRAVVRFHVDVNVGDPIWPEPQQFSLPRLIDGVISSYEKRAAQRKNDFEVLTRIEART
jgi:hypothetical protein